MWCSPIASTGCKHLCISSELHAWVYTASSPCSQYVPCHIQSYFLLDLPTHPWSLLAYNWLAIYHHSFCNISNKNLLRLNQWDIVWENRKRREEKGDVHSETWWLTIAIQESLQVPLWCLTISAYTNSCLWFPSWSCGCLIVRFWFAFLTWRMLLFALSVMFFCLMKICVGQYEQWHVWLVQKSTNLKQVDHTSWDNSEPPI